jgi:hypothetical protein
MAKFRIVGISFDHMHMGDLLRLVHDHPEAEIAGLYDPDMAKMQAVAGKFGVARTASSPISTPAWPPGPTTWRSSVPPPPITPSMSNASPPMVSTSSWKNPSPPPPPTRAG